MEIKTIHGEQVVDMSLQEAFEIVDRIWAKHPTKELAVGLASELPQLNIPVDAPDTKKKGVTLYS